MSRPDGPRPAPPAGDAEPRAPLGAWPRLYALVAAELLLTILLLAWITRAFA